MNLKVVYGDEESIYNLDGLDGVVGYIGDPRDDFFIGMLRGLMEGGRPLVIHDTHGFYKDDAPVYVDAGIEFKMNIISDQDIFTLSLKALTEYFRFKYPYWEVSALSSIKYFYRAAENVNLESYIQYIINKSTESTGIEKSSYLVLSNLLAGIFDPSIVLRLSSDVWSSLRDDSHIFIGYKWMNSYIARVFVSTISFLYLMRNYPGHIHILIDSILLGRLPKGFLMGLTRNGRAVIHSYTLSDIPKYVVNTLFLNPLYVDDFHILERLRIPLYSEDIDILLYDRVLYLPVKYDRGMRLPGRDRREEVKPHLLDYIGEYREVVREILELLNSYGEMSIDGIYINVSGGDRPLISSLVINLWRDGYLNRISDRRGTRYRMSVEGIKLLRRLRGDE